MKKTIGVFLSLGVIVIVSTLFLINITVDAKEIKLHNLYDSQEDVCKSFYSNRWEIFKSKAEVSDQFADKFKEIYEPLLEGRYE